MEKGKKKVEWGKNFAARTAGDQTMRKVSEFVKSETKPEQTSDLLIHQRQRQKTKIKKIKGITDVSIRIEGHDFNHKPQRSTV